MLENVIEKKKTKLQSREWKKIFRLLIETIVTAVAYIW